MSDQERTEQTSAEDRFLGVKTQITKRAKDEPTTEAPIEVEEQSQDFAEANAARDQAASQDDDELENYSDKVKKRIDRLTYEKHQARREFEEAKKDREEAIRYAQQVHQRNQEYENLITNGEAILVEQIKARASLAAAQAEEHYRKAYEEGNTDAMVAAQKALFQAQAEQKEADAYSRDYQNRRQQYLAWHQQRARQPRPMPQQQPQQPQVPQPTSEAVEWAQENPWFGKEKAMTAYAYGRHEELIGSGIAADSPEYYKRINESMREKFPEYFESARDSGQGRYASSSSRSAPSVVASAGRNNGAKPSKVKLTPSQVKLAKRLGITPEQYARQLTKGM
jgi:hypothetical protein